MVSFLALLESFRGKGMCQSEENGKISMGQWCPNFAAVSLTHSPVEKSSTPDETGIVYKKRDSSAAQPFVVCLSKMLGAVCLSKV